MLKKNLHTIIVLFILTTIACTKYKNMTNDVEGTGYLRGRIFIADSLNGLFNEKSKSGVTVKLSTNEQGEDYIYSDSSDAEGYFIFESLSPEKNYFIQADTKEGDVIYYANVAVNTKMKDIPIVLTPKQKGQNSLTFSIRNANYELIKNCKICLYSNALLASDTTNCNGSIWDASSNEYGKATKVNLPEGRYYANFSYTLGDVTFRAHDTIAVKKEGSIFRQIKLYPVIAKTNSIGYLIKDSLGMVVPKCDVCAFSSFVLANDSCIGANWNAKGDESGKIKLTKILAGSYAVKFKVEVGALKLSAVDTIFNLTDTTQYTKIIVVK